MLPGISGNDKQLSRILVVAGEGPNTLELISGLSGGGYHPLLASKLDQAFQLCDSETPAVVMMDFSVVAHGDSQVKEFIKSCKNVTRIPVIALLSVEKMASFDFTLGVDDIMAAPPKVPEALARIKRLLTLHRTQNGKNLLSFGDLVIDVDRYEVTLSGRTVELTFKEYELLKFLATSPGKVFTREIMLNKVWGYDYFGGTRTVDVHVRRLRSKIEDANHTFIDTVRNVGYRFKDR